MFEDISLAGYPILGFVVCYVTLELAWHFTACKIKEGTTLKPCLFKELRKQILIVGKGFEAKYYGSS